MRHRARTLGVAIDPNRPAKQPPALVRGILDAARDRGWRSVLDPFPGSLSYDGVILRATRALARTVHDEIVRAHVARAKRLLAAGDEPLQRVALLSGLGTPQRLSQVFRRRHRPE